MGGGQGLGIGVRVGNEFLLSLSFLGVVSVWSLAA